MVQGTMGKLEVETVCSNTEKNFCLNISVILRCKIIVATPIPSQTKQLFAKGLVKDKLGGVC